MITAEDVVPFTHCCCYFLNQVLTRACLKLVFVAFSSLPVISSTKNLQSSHQFPTAGSHPLQPETSKQETNCPLLTVDVCLLKNQPCIKELLSMYDVQRSLNHKVDRGDHEPHSSGSWASRTTKKGLSLFLDTSLVPSSISMCGEALANGLGGGFQISE
eukprot:TRINITY_DN10613_c0_g2_i1.p1 TRINITY_DN10613_c0_g2~~TRINITY_DN10613_c0_g2_i1.p1  ORF type:complete len:159 (+),score=31.90 TRINITY_DN10613_c0_g2_i1:262-738(+)